MSKVNVVVGQSGGPTAVINSSLYGVIKESFAHPEEIDKVYGMVNGIQGFIEDRYIDVKHDMTEEEIELLVETIRWIQYINCRFMPRKPTVL